MKSEWSRLNHNDVWCFGWSMISHCEVGGFGWIQDKLVWSKMNLDDFG